MENCFKNRCFWKSSYLMLISKLSMSRHGVFQIIAQRADICSEIIIVKCYIELALLTWYRSIARSRSWLLLLILRCVHTLLGKSFISIESFHSSFYRKGGKLQRRERTEIELWSPIEPSTLQLAETAAEIGSKAGDKNGGRSEWQDDTRILNQPKAELRTGWPDTSRNS